MKTRDRLLSGLLAFALCFGMLSPAALAVDGEDIQSPDGLEDVLDQAQTPEPTQEQTPEPAENEDPPVAETPAADEPEDENNVFQDEPEDEPNAPEPYADEITLTASLVGVDALTSAKDVGRVRLNTAGETVVVDEITYSIDAADKDKVILDEKTGEIKWAEGYTPAADETVTVTVNYKYYSGADVKYVENFDDNTAKPFTNTNYAINDGQSRTGEYGVTPSGTTPNSPATVAVGPFDGVRVTAWYYDPFTEEEQSCTNTMKFGFAATHDTGTPNTNQLGVFFGSGAGDGTKTHYAYRIVTSGNFSASPQVRSAGWHKLEWVVTSNDGTVMYIDGTQVATEASRTQVANLTLATNWVAQNTNDQAGMNLIRNHHYIDDVSIVALSATPQSGTATVAVNLKAPEPPKPPALTFGNGGEDEALTKGNAGRVYLDNMEDYVIADVTYTTNNANVLVDKSGNLIVKDGYAPKDGETVKVTAVVTYYNNKEDVIFSDSFEGDKLFTTPGVYAHSTVNPLFGRYAATPQGSTTGYPAKTLTAVSDVTVTAWYYDENAGNEDQLKFGFGINGGGDKGGAMGIFFDSSIAPLVDGNTIDHYGMRVSGTTYNKYSWGGSDVERSQGWHKFEWVIDSSKGMTAKIDGKVVSTHQGTVGGDTIPALAPVQDNENVKELTEIRLMEGWNNNATNLGNIANRHFIDGVTVVKTGATTENCTLTSAEIPVLDTQYTTTPETITVENSAYPKNVWLQVEPDLSELTSVKVDSTTLSASQWHITTEDDAPKNASYYPVGELIVYADAFKGLSAGQHTLALVMSSGSVHNVKITVAEDKAHTPTDYYLSNSGKDTNDGHTANTAWATFDKLSTVTFGPGDRIYLDATSVWNGVQFRPLGSGAEGAPIIITKYNDGGDASKRPILNGSGTVADTKTHSYAAFGTWRGFYPSGTIELFNVENWEVRGVEITNYAQEYQQTGVGRNGIAVIYDYLEIQGLDWDFVDEMWDFKDEYERAFYRAGKLQHIVIEDCYIHDVTGYHPGSGGKGAGGKMSGGINAYGPYDDLKLDNNIIMYCDVEGIRNDVLAWRGDTRTQFPCYMEGVSISNNFIVGVPGDGVVISSAVEPKLAHNYLTDAGYSYFVPQAGKFSNDGSFKPKAMGNRSDPIIVDNSTNFAGLWFIGTMDAVAEFNESVNNVWTCNDGEAFDADMFTWGTVFQYNYTYKNNGGLCLFMSGNQMDDGTVVRYNVSVMDGEGVGTPNDGRKAIFHYNKEPDAIYNNLFILGDGVRGMFGGSSNTAYFYNNMVIKPDGQIGSFNLNTTSNTNAAANAMTDKTQLNNNLFYPAAILNNVSGSFQKLNNITPDTLDGIFVDLNGFMDSQPVQALKGRSVLTGDTVTMTDGKGAGVAMSAEAGRSVTVPSGAGFDYAQFEGIKILEGAPTIGAGTPVTLTIWPQTEDVHPLTKDFFQNSIRGVAVPDIGPYNWAADPNHYVKVTLNGNGTDTNPTPLYAKVGGTVAKPADPVRGTDTFKGWYESADCSGTPVSWPYTVTKAGTTLYAGWEKSDPSVLYVIFDTQGGSEVAPVTNLKAGDKVPAPADPTKPGCYFEGWYKDAEGTEKWDFDVDTVTGDTTIYAVWEMDYTVVFDKNGGDTQANPSTKVVSPPLTTVIDLPAPPTREGYEFLGWNTAADGSGTEFTADTKVTDNIVVYAQWKSTGTVTVTYNANGGTLSGAAQQEVAPGGTVGTLPAAPTRSGYSFTGWNTAADGTGTAFTASTVVNDDITVYAQWRQTGGGNSGGSGSGGGSSGGGSRPTPTPKPTPKPEETPRPITPADNVSASGGGEVSKIVNDNGSVTYYLEPEEEQEVLHVRVNGIVKTITADELTVDAGDSVVVIFGDPDANHLESFADSAAVPGYAAGAVEYVVSAQLFQGMSDGRFAPEGNMDRAMFATVLSRLYGADTAGLTSSFADVSSGAWYEGPVTWAANMGFVNGVSSTHFAPDSSITRQEMITMIYRFAGKVGVDVSARADLSRFGDSAQVADWAADAMAWAVDIGLIQGRPEGIAPADTITRAEAAIILQRMATLLEN